jgi:arylsulfatase A-like enzyme
MAKKPNVILITIDCLRADYCGWLNPNKKELTPFLNSLAKECIVFTNTYATGPRTSLSFPGILTGTYPLSFNGWDKKNFPGLEQRPYLPEILYNNGYFTIAVHDNPYLSAFFGYDRGFDIFKDLKEKSKKWFFSMEERTKPNFLCFCIKWCFHKLNRYKWYNHFRNYFFRRFPKVFNFLKKILIQNRKSKPKKLFPITPAQIINKFVLEEMRFSQALWFLWIHYMELHEPYFPAKKILLPSNISKRDLEKANIQYMDFVSYQNLKEENFELIKKLYQLNIKYLDQQISQLFRKLKDKIRNSIIVITADHGQEFGEHGGAGHTSKKTDDSKLYKEVLHVPLMIIIPDKDSRIINDIVTSAQIPATILEIVGIKPPLEMQPSLFSENKIKVFSETLLECSPLWDKFNLSTRQEVVFKD